MGFFLLSTPLGELMSIYKNFTYDDGGRITAINNTGSTRNFTYDEESRLVSISGAYSATYQYNGLREPTDGWPG